MERKIYCYAVNTNQQCDDCINQSCYTPCLKSQMRPTEHDNPCITCSLELWGYCTHHEKEIPDMGHTTCSCYTDIMEDYK